MIKFKIKLLYFYFFRLRQLVPEFEMFVVLLAEGGGGKGVVLH